MATTLELADKSHARLAELQDKQTNQGNKIRSANSHTCLSLNEYHTLKRITSATQALARNAK